MWASGYPDLVSVRSSCELGDTHGRLHFTGFMPGV